MGAKGNTGDAGAAGAKGNAGGTGAKGDIGDKGTKGAPALLNPTAQVTPPYLEMGLPNQEITGQGGSTDWVDITLSGGMITESQNTGADINLANDTIVLSAGLWRIAIAVDYNEPQTTGGDPRTFLNSRIIKVGGAIAARAKNDQYQRYIRTTDRKYYVDHMFFLDDPTSVILQTGLISIGANSPSTPLSSTGGQIQILMHNSIRGKDGSPRYVKTAINGIAGQSVVTLAHMVDKLFTAFGGTTTFQINSDRLLAVLANMRGLAL